MNKLHILKELLNLRENMYNFALTLTPDRQDAQDLLQDTILKVLDNQEKFIDNRNFKGWVLTIMRNIFINNYNRIVRTQSIIDRDADLYNLDMENSSLAYNPDCAYELKELINFVDGLKPEYKIPFSLYEAGYKYEEIAEELDIPIGTVKSRIFIARQKLQQQIMNN